MSIMNNDNRKTLMSKGNGITSFSNCFNSHDNVSKKFITNFTPGRGRTKKKKKKKKKNTNSLHVKLAEIFQLS